MRERERESADHTTVNSSNNATLGYMLLVYEETYEYIFIHTCINTLLAHIHIYTHMHIYICMHTWAAFRTELKGGGGGGGGGEK